MGCRIRVGKAMLGLKVRLALCLQENTTGLPFWIPPGGVGHTHPPVKPPPAGAFAHRPAVIPLGL